MVEARAKCRCRALLLSNVIITFVIIDFFLLAACRTQRMIRRELHAEIFANRRQTHMRGRRLSPRLLESSIAFDCQAVPNMVDCPPCRTGDLGIDRLKIYAPAVGRASPA